MVSYVSQNPKSAVLLIESCPAIKFVCFIYVNDVATIGPMTPLENICHVMIIRASINTVQTKFFIWGWLSLSITDYTSQRIENITRI